MREAAFMKQNATRWQDYEKKILQDDLSPDTRADLFIQLTDDLSFAQTQYSNSETTAYLNQLASRAHQSIYKIKREEQNRFITFWTQEIPLLFASLRKPMFYSIVITFIATVIGAISVLQDDTFVRLNRMVFSSPFDSRSGTILSRVKV